MLYQDWRGFLMDKAKHDAGTNARAYEAYVGRWSQATAQPFLSWLNVPEDSTWLDPGCGTGALRKTILDRAFPQKLIGIEPPESFLALTRERNKDKRASFEPGTGASIPIQGHSVDVLVSGYVLNVIPDLVASLLEMKRVLKPGGTLAAYVWDYAGKAEFIRFFWDAAVQLNEKAKEFDEGVRFPICHPEALEQSFKQAGLENMGIHAIDIPTSFRDFNDYWQPFLGGIGPAPGYVASLNEEQKQKLASQLKERLPIASDGPFSLTAWSWAIKALS